MIAPRLDSSLCINGLTLGKTHIYLEPRLNVELNLCPAVMTRVTHFGAVGPLSALSDLKVSLTQAPGFLETLRADAELCANLDITHAQLAGSLARLVGSSNDSLSWWRPTDTSMA